MVSFLPFEQRKLRRDGLHLFNIRYWDPALPALAQPGESLMVRYDPRNLSKVYVAARDGRYHPVPYADLGLPPITLWEQRAAIARLHAEGDAAPGEARREWPFSGAGRHLGVGKMANQPADGGATTCGSISRSRPVTDRSASASQPSNAMPTYLPARASA